MKTTPFNNTQIRTVYDNTHKKHWFSAVDICAAITGKDYNTARNYWKWLKSKLQAECSELVSTTNRLKLLAADGKYRFTDVMDITDVLKLIQLCPCKNAEKFRLWILRLASGPKLLKKAVKAIVNGTKNYIDKLTKPVCVTSLIINTRRREILGIQDTFMVTG